MELSEYKIMYEAEDSHWWYRGLRAAMSALLKLDRVPRDGPRLLDAGCGTGGNLNYLREAGFTRLSGFDYNEHAIYFCGLRGLKNIRQGSATEIPFEDGLFDVVISCDMLNDAGISDERGALRELYRVLKPGGRIFLNLPALGFLAGEHDRATSVARRYTRGSISHMLREAGFEVRRVTYRNMLLFPLIFVVRKLRSDSSEKESARSDIALPPAPVNALLFGIMRLEALLLRYVDLPIGSSLSVVASRPRWQD